MIGVFIPTEMPQKCYECFYGHDCELINPYYVEEQRPVDCPLISVELDDVPSDWITKVKKEKGYKGCRNCQHQISPMRMCKWAEQKTEVTLHIMCPKWERKKDVD